MRFDEVHMLLLENEYLVCLGQQLGGKGMVVAVDASRFRVKSQLLK